MFPGPQEEWAECEGPWGGTQSSVPLPQLVEPGRQVILDSQPGWVSAPTPREQPFPGVLLTPGGHHPQPALVREPCDLLVSGNERLPASLPPSSSPFSPWYSWRWGEGVGGLVGTQHPDRLQGNARPHRLSAVSREKGWHGQRPWWRGSGTRRGPSVDSLPRKQR